MKKRIGILLGIGLLAGTAIAGYKFLESPRYSVYQACEAVKSKDLAKVQERIDLKAIAGQVAEYYTTKLGPFAMAMSMFGGSVDSYIEEKLKETIVNAKEDNLEKINCLGLMYKVEIEKTGETAEVSLTTKSEKAGEVKIKVGMQKEKGTWKVKQVRGETLEMLGKV